MWSTDLANAIERDAVYYARRVRWRIDAEDLAQDGWLAALEFLARRGDADPALVRHVASQGMVATIRREIARPTVEMADATRERLTTRSGDQAIALDVRDVIDELTPYYRTAILSTLDGPPSKTHANLGMTQNTLETALYRARVKLRARLGDAYEHMARKHHKRYGKIGRANAKRRAKTKETA